MFWSLTPLTDDFGVGSVGNLYRRTDLDASGAGTYELITRCPLCETSGVPLPPLPSMNVVASTWKPLLAGASPDFEHIVFAHDGTGLFYTLDRADGTHTVERDDLVTGEVTEVASFDAPVADVVETTGFPPAFTIGAGCDNHHAGVVRGSDVAALAGDVAAPVSLVGRLDAHRFVVTSGGCDKPADVYVVADDGTPSTLLMRGVDAVAMRTPEPTPAPPLPEALPRSGFA